MKKGSVVFSLFLFLLLAGYSFTVQAQAPAKTDLFKDANGDTFHQLFLDFQAKEMIEIKYSSDDTPVDGQLTSDGYSVIIKNYPGNKSVKLKLIDSDGNEKEVTKSKCFIDPVLLQLL